MKKHGQYVCPGCSKHCAVGCARCKYGKSYFAKHNITEAERGASSRRKQRKWEKKVTEGGLLWNALWTFRAVKKALRRGELTEEKLLCALSEEEKQQLGAILEKTRPFVRDLLPDIAKDRDQGI